MKKPFPFGAVLARLRREAGFLTPHSFYRGRGGAKVLRLSFANYLGLEHGRNLPKAWRLKILLQALGLPEGAPQKAELVRAYLAGVLGSEELLGELSSAGAEDAPGVRLGEEAAALAINQRRVNRSLAQWKVLADDLDAYVCSTYLNNSPGYVSAGDLAAATGLAPAAVKRVLKTLAGARLIELSGSRARSPYSYKFVSSLPTSPATVGLKSRLLEHWETLARRGKMIRDSGLYVRIPKRNLARYWKHMQAAVDLAAVYGDAEKTPDTELYMIDARLFRLFP